MTRDTPLDPRWGKPSFAHDPSVLAHFEARPTDVLIATAPKAGTTWMQQILHQMRSGGDPDFGAIFEVVPWLEFPLPGTTWEERLARFEAIPEPRVFKTHCTVEQLPGLGVAKVVLTFRDPRECCVSMFHHIQGLQPGMNPGGTVATMQENVDHFLAFGAWYRNVAGWWKVRERDDVLVFRYADLKRDLGAAVDRLSSFLGWPLSPEARGRVLELSSFTWMRSHSDKFTRMSSTGPTAFKEGAFIRKGEVGRADDELTPEQSKAIVDRAKEVLEPACLEWLGIA